MGNTRIMEGQGGSERLQDVVSVTTPGGRGSKQPHRECAGGRSDERKTGVGRIGNTRLAEA